MSAKRKRRDQEPSPQLVTNKNEETSTITDPLTSFEDPDSGSNADFSSLEFDSDSDTETSESASVLLSSEEDFDLDIFPKSRTILSDITGQLKREFPEIEPNYDSDSSTEEDPNRVGNVPMHWYDDLPHVGYDINGVKLLRPAKGDELDKFLSTVDNPSSWNSAFDQNSHLDRPLSYEELDIIHRLQKGENPSGTYDPYEPTVEWFTGKGKEEKMPLSAGPEPKRRWIPSKWEKQKVIKIVRAIRQGRIVPSKPRSSERDSSFYDVWSSENSSAMTSGPISVAPKRMLPTNSESYNPPQEYIPNEQERKEWEATDTEDRECDYLPQSFSSLRHVPAYPNFIQERFNRQLDLYLAPRVQRKRLNVDPESLIPKLPSPNSLRPFPTYWCVQVPHLGRVRCVATSPDGSWVVSGDETGVVNLWEVLIGNQIKQYRYPSKITALEWCPRTDATIVAIASEHTIELCIPPHQPSDVMQTSLNLLSPKEQSTPVGFKSSVVWKPAISQDATLSIHLPAELGITKQIVFHSLGDYFATLSESEGQTSIWIHQMSKRHSQSPFRKLKGIVQKILFHPKKPMFYVATQRYVRVYDLVEQKLVKTLQPGIKWISSMDIHASGNHLIVGGFDRKLCWFDLELSEKPYKVLRYHSRAIRALHFHRTYPLFASCSDDGTVQVFHARVYNDLMTDPLIVPLKILRGHKVADGLGILDIGWCANLPWLVSGGADGYAKVWM